MVKVVAIHQPNFFPWLGYFDKIASSDVFILFDDIQFPKTGGVWSNRVKFLVSGEAKWVTANIIRNYHGTRNINEMEFRSDIPWREKMLRTIEMNYKKAPFFGEVMDMFEPLVSNPENNIAEYNCHVILNICTHLGLPMGNLIRSSAIDHCGSSNELLIDLTKKVGGSAYMCGGGADGYQDEDIFKKYAVNLIFQNFKHPSYHQYRAPSFQPGLSIIDAAMNLGWSDVRIFFERPSD